jgi:hypothetical protein
LYYLYLCEQASINHQKIAECLAGALEKINESIFVCKADLEMFQTKIMMEQIAELYARIFFFLSTFMDWFTKKSISRFLDAFNEDTSEKFGIEIKSITYQADTIRKLVEQGSRAEMRDTRLTVEGIREETLGLRHDLAIGFEGAARLQAEISHQLFRLEREQRFAEAERRRNHELDLAKKINDMLRQSAILHLQNQHSRCQKSPLPWETATTSGLYSVSGGHSPSSAVISSEVTRDEMAMNSAHLEDYFDRDRVRLPYDIFDQCMVSPEILQRLADWAAGQLTEDSGFLWLNGAPIEAEDIENPLTMLAAQFTELASQSKAPIMSYFCELRRFEDIRVGNASQEVQSVVSLGYSLIRQMVDLLLPVSQVDTDLCEKRFQQLDGTAKSWVDALCILRDLTKLLPDLVFCVIDGLHWIDDDTQEMLTDIIEVLRDEKFKVLFTTTGRVSCLWENIGMSSVVTVDDLDNLRDDSHGLDSNFFNVTS